MDRKGIILSDPLNRPSCWYSCWASSARCSTFPNVVYSPGSDHLGSRSLCLSFRRAPEPTVDRLSKGSLSVGMCSKITKPERSIPKNPWRVHENYMIEVGWMPFIKVSRMSESKCEVQWIDREPVLSRSKGVPSPSLPLPRGILCRPDCHTKRNDIESMERVW